ncbi:Retrovirus-related Pol polyprotein from transposon TNT 1-94-like protein [Drosera capensis]
MIVPHPKKLDDRSQPMVYLGVEEGCKTHRLYNPRQKKLHISRVVIFQQNLWWNWSAGTDDELSEFVLSNSSNSTKEPKGVAGTTELESTASKELKSIEKKNTWTLTKLPPGHKPIGLKWVFQLKKDIDGRVVKHKARLVAKGYIQRQGTDFKEVFAPVAKRDMVRMILALAVNQSWEVHHMDVKSTFLNGELEEELYATQSKGFEVQG